MERFKYLADPLLICSATLVSILLFSLVKFNWGVDWLNVLPIYLASGMLIWAGFRVQTWPQAQAQAWGMCVSMVGASFLLAATAAFACTALARAGLPFVDQKLADVDALLGFYWLDCLAFLKEYPLILVILGWAYASLALQQQAIIILLSLFRPPATIKRFMLAWTVSLLITVIAFPFFPAVAAFDFYSLSPTDVPALTAQASWNLTGLMDAIRTGENSTLDLLDLTGPVTFPSLHAAMAVLLGYYFWTFKWLRWPAVVLNVLMFFSAVPNGGHYLVDIIAGGIMAVVSIVVAARAYRGQSGDRSLPSSVPLHHTSFA